MKIAVIAKTRLPISEPFKGGLEAFTYTLCKGYLNRGHEITLYAHANSDPDLNVKSFYGNEHRSDSFFDIYENDEYISILKDIEQGDFDVVHNNATHELPIMWGAKASIPVITTLHTPPISKLKAAIKICSNYSNLKFVTPSRFLRSVWQPFIDKGLVVINNGVDLEKWPLVRTGRDYLFWYGRIVYEKGLDIVLDAAHEIGMPLKFAGPCDDEQYYNEHIHTRIIDDDVYLGHLTQSELHFQMRNAAAMVNAVRWDEPFGLTNIEAMSAGVPVAGFDRGAFKELITSDSGTVAEQQNVKSLANAILKAIPLESIYVRRHAETFSVHTMIMNYIKLFESLI